MLGMHIGKCNDKEMLQSRIQKQIPERLSHYTNLEALWKVRLISICLKNMVAIV